MTWTRDELDKIGNAEELRLASLKSDGTLRKPVTIWVVRVGDDLYVRPVAGRTGTWFRGTQESHAGHIRAGGVDKDVSFVDPDPAINDQIDAGYRAKYRRYAANITNSVPTPKARAAAIKLAPRKASS